MKIKYSLHRYDSVCGDVLTPDEKRVSCANVADPIIISEVRSALKLLHSPVFVQGIIAYHDTQNESSANSVKQANRSGHTTQIILQDANGEGTLNFAGQDYQVYALYSCVSECRSIHSLFEWDPNLHRI
jgi:hypothetical protein